MAWRGPFTFALARLRSLTLGGLPRAGLPRLSHWTGSASAEEGERGGSGCFPQD